MLYQRLSSSHCNSPKGTLDLQLVSYRMLWLINLHIICIFLTLTFIFVPAQGVSYDFTDNPGRGDVNFSDIIFSLTELTSQSSTNITYNTTTVYASRRYVKEKSVADGSTVPRDSPTALVIASSIAAVCILVFFVLAYLWHTHQLDSRARKLAIRLAADAEHGMRCRTIRPQVTRGYPRVIPREKARNISESSQEQNQYIVLTPEEERGAGSDGGRSSVGVSENEALDDEDTFEPVNIPPIGERGRSGARSGRGAHRKLSRSRKSYSGANLDKRDSAVTDKEILTHFASRRHSTFFI